MSYRRSATVEVGAGLLLIGADAAVGGTALHYLEGSGKAFLPRSQVGGWLGAGSKPAPLRFAGTLSVPEWPEVRGLGASDAVGVYLDAPPWLPGTGAEIGVFHPLDPWSLDLEVPANRL